VTWLHQPQQSSRSQRVYREQTPNESSLWTRYRKIGITISPIRSCSTVCTTNACLIPLFLREEETAPSTATISQMQAKSGDVTTQGWCFDLTVDWDSWYQCNQSQYRAVGCDVTACHLQSS
jgi:hypothetical protein